MPPAVAPMTLTAHERKEWQRAAAAMYARGANDLGHLLSAAAAKKTIPTAQFDRAATAYRAWLVFDEPKSNPPRKRAASSSRGYVATYRNGKRVRFNARSDDAARRYAKGLGAARARSVATDLRRVPKRNPSSRSEAQRAARALERFTGDEPQFIRAQLKTAKAGWALGEVPEIHYIATRDGRTDHYRHRFKAKNRPLLVASADGKQLYVLGGAFSVTERGIEDA